MTLVEFIVAVCILGFVIGLMFELVPFSHVINRRAWNTHGAQEIAASQIAAMRALPFADLPASTGPVALKQEGEDYTYTVTTQPAYKGYQSLALVTVEVDWDENGGAQKLVLQSLLSDIKASP